jgi:putative FmdB family regulatory protein
MSDVKVARALVGSDIWPRPGAAGYSWHSTDRSASAWHEHREDVVPTYQYACTECGHDLEAVQSFADDALTECPRCHGRLRKVFGAVGIVFKGSGFYRNDSRDKKPVGAEAKSDGKVDATTGSTSDTTTGSTTSDAAASSNGSGGNGSGGKRSNGKHTNGKDSGSAKAASTASSTSSTKGTAA